MRPDPRDRLGKRVWMWRVAWLVGIWAASVAALAVAAWMMRAVMRFAGMA
jgi:hypothetical protein